MGNQIILCGVSFDKGPGESLSAEYTMADFRVNPTSKLITIYYIDPRLNR